MFTFMPLVYIILALILFLAVIMLFKNVRTDYHVHGRLSSSTAFLKTAYFCIYALCSYLFLDSRPSSVATRSPVFIAALALMGLGAAAVLLSMPALGRRSFGQDVGSLQTTGLYRYSRNPQLVGGFLFILGYAILWPSWHGLLWCALWIPIAHLMVRGEEEHLARVFGQEYTDYCRRTPRYLGFRRG
jgi:protein-S-isoprenylcysteine O-methyltransferase Ste14